MPSSSCIIHLASRHGAGVEVFVLSLKSYLISAGDSPCGRDVLLVGVEVSPSLVIIARGDSAKFTLRSGQGTRVKRGCRLFGSLQRKVRILTLKNQMPTNGDLNIEGEHLIVQIWNNNEAWPYPLQLVHHRSRLAQRADVMDRSQSR